MDRRVVHDAVIRVYDVAGNVIETHEHKGEPLAAATDAHVLCQHEPLE